MKKYKALYLELILLIISFLTSWYGDNIVMNTNIHMYSIIKIIMLIMFIKLCTLTAKTNKICLLMFIPILLTFGYNFRIEKTKYELKKYEDERNIIIEEVKNTTYNKENITLDNYQYVSNDKSIYIYQNDTEQVIGFWIYRGYETSVQLIYTSKDENLIYNSIDKNNIMKMEKLKDNWFYIETN